MINQFDKDGDDGFINFDEFLLFFAEVDHEESVSSDSQDMEDSEEKVESESVYESSESSPKKEQKIAAM